MELGDCADSLRIVESFRKRGIRCSALHAFLSELLAARAAHGFEGFVDLKAGAGGGGTLTMCCAAFLLDVQLEPAPSLARALPRVQLEHTATDAPAWAHASREQLEAELLAALHAADARGFFARLEALREAQRLAAEAAVEPEWYARQWSAVAASVDAAVGGGATRCCEGLRVAYFAPPGLEACEGAYEAAVSLAPPAAGEGGATGPPRFKLQLSPPLLLLERSPAAKREVEAFGAIGAVAAVQEFALHGVGHAQQWELVADRHLDGVVLSELMLDTTADTLADRLRQLLVQLRWHAAFLHVARSCIADALLQDPPTADGAVTAKYRLEAQAHPPTSLAVICHLPPAADGLPRLAELKCELRPPSSDPPAKAEAPTWAASLSNILLTDQSEASSEYASGLLNASHSLPLTLAYIACYGDAASRLEGSLIAQQEADQDQRPRKAMKIESDT
ncbi:hypothetical protein AB1Y20_004554 [Prymnesium parvum]|uniref:Inositol-pentakisphosphate 2-kinase n=1 Tax=Prymnesium parvum TaxID=97485 RepID=A0AB34IWJ3_PRYPA